jgi:hypothetical protein
MSIHDEEVRGVEGQLQVFLNSVLDGGEWRVSLSGRYILEKKAPFTKYLEDGWAPEEVWKLWRGGINLYPCRKSKFVSPIVHYNLFTTLTELSWLHYTSSLVAKS